MTGDYALAQLATPLKGWTSGPIELRALSMADVTSYERLGRDPDFHWDRELKPPSFSEFMIGFRVAHYRRFGFGIMGCWRGGQLIGQAGLQVVPEDESKIEMAVFLGREHRGEGLGRLLNSELMRRCGAVGMERIYGIVRADNEAASNLMTKLGGQVVGQAMHYGQMAIEFEFLLKVTE